MKNLFLLPSPVLERCETNPGELSVVDGVYGSAVYGYFAGDQLMRFTQKDAGASVRQVMQFTLEAGAFVVDLTHADIRRQLLAFVGEMASRGLFTKKRVVTIMQIGLYPKEVCAFVEANFPKASGFVVPHDDGLTVSKMVVITRPKGIVDVMEVAEAIFEGVPAAERL